MNEGENIGMSNGAIFSSDNMSDPIEPIMSTPTEAPAPAPAPDPTPTQTDPISDAPADAAPTATPIFSSGSTDDTTEPDLPAHSIITVPRKTGGAAKLGFMRRFQKKEDKPAPSWGAHAMPPKTPAAPEAAPITSGDVADAPANDAAAANATPAASLMSKIKAPEYFSNAVEDIASVDNERAARRGSAKRVLKIGGITLAAVAVIAGIVFGLSMFLNSQKANQARLAWTRFGNYVIYGEEKDDELPETLDPKLSANTNNYTLEGNSFNLNNEATLRSKYKDAKAAISAIAKEDDLKKLDSYIDFTFSIVKNSKSLSDIAHEYVDSGKDGYINKLDALLAEYRGDEKIALVANKFADFEKSSVALIEKYASIGCLDNDGSINNECLNENKEKYTEERSKYESAKLTYSSNTKAKMLVIEEIKTIMEQLK